MKTLVTGGTGFIGTHLVKALVQQGRDVRCLVRKNSDTRQLNELGVELFYGDILNKDSLKNIASDINSVYHLVGVIYSKKCRDYYRVNFDGTKNLVEVCLPENIDRFIFLSSIAAVGPNPDHGIMLNEQSPCRPIDPYGKSKLEAENLLMQCFKKQGFPAVIVRPPTVYGPSDRSIIIKKILHRAQRGTRLIVGSKNNSRSMCYIDNLIQGMLAVDRFTDSIGEIFFLADERTYTYNEIFQIVAEEIGIILKETRLPGWIGNICGLSFKSLALLGFYSLPLYMVWHMILDMACDITKAKKELQFTPKIDLKEGLQKTIRYCLNKNSIEIS